MKASNLRVAVASASLLLVLALVALDVGRGGAAPGPLAPAHAALPELSEPGTCAACHADTLAAGCLSCHERIGGDLERGAGFHGRLADVDPRACEACHAEHHGASAPLVGARSFERAGFSGRDGYDHRGLAFTLEGAHDALGCERCHPLAEAPATARGELRFGGLEQRCAACHEDVHEGRFGARCADCHGQQRPFEDHAGFVHPDALPLVGAHGRAACTDCHAEGTERAVAALARGAERAPRACLDCHESPHAAPFLAGVAAALGRAPAASCAGCHDPERAGFKDGADAPTRALHAASGFPLDAAPHAELACAACHVPGEPYAVAAPRRPEDCAACHADPHGGQFGVRGEDRGGCIACHERTRFLPPRYDAEAHAAAGWPLERAHARAECLDCHGAELDELPGCRRFVGTPRACADCHDDAHAAAFEGRSCGECHDTGRFADVLAGAFEHAPATGFALDGAHGRAECEACHRRAEAPDALGRRFGRVAALFGEPARACATCHRDVHAGGFDRPGLPDEVDGRAGCARCHDAERFDALPHGSFDHALWTGVALEGAHARAECAVCHAPAPRPDADGRRFGRAADLFEDFSRGCAGCHEDPHAGRFERAGVSDCAACHGQESFRFADLAVFDHARWTGFALEAAHGRLDCAACHDRPAPDARQLGLAAGARCADCHDDVHRGQFVRDGAADCARCHPRPTRFSEVVFDHQRDARFPLDDKHDRLACGACHRAWKLADGTSAVRYRPLGRECADCHGGGKR